MLKIVRTSQEYEWQPIGAPYKKKLEPMPPRVRRESPPPQRGLHPSEFDNPLPMDDPESLVLNGRPELAQQQTETNLHIEQQLDIMRESLTRHLTANLQADPDAYFYEEKDIPVVVERFMNAFQRGQFVGTDRSVKMMCKELGIKATPKSMAKFIFSREL